MGGERQLMCHWAGTKPPTDFPRRLLPMQVTSDHEGKDELLACIGGTIVLTPSSGI
jgi:hypothetical protein